MSYTTWKALKAEILKETDTEDEVFIQELELRGFANDALRLIEDEIMDLHENYFETHTSFKLKTGKSLYDLPEDIVDWKVNSFWYRNGTDVYEIKRPKKYLKYDGLESVQVFGDGDLYSWKPANPTPIDLVCTITVDTPALVTSASHGFQEGERVLLFTTGALPSGLSIDTYYYVTNKTDDTFNLARTQDGSLINTSGTQSGVHNVKNLGNKVELYPASRETSSNAEMWYIRSIKRISMTADSATADNTLLEPSQFTDVVKHYCKLQIMMKDKTVPLDDFKANYENAYQRMIEMVQVLVPDNMNELSGDFSTYKEMN